MEVTRDACSARSRGPNLLHRSTQTAEAVYDRPVTRVTSVSLLPGLIYLHEEALSLVWIRG